MRGPAPVVEVAPEQAVSLYGRQRAVELDRVLAAQLLGVDERLEHRQRPQALVPAVEQEGRRHLPHSHRSLHLTVCEVHPVKVMAWRPGASAANLLSSEMRAAASAPSTVTASASTSRRTRAGGGPARDLDVVPRGVGQVVFDGGDAAVPRDLREAERVGPGCHLRAHELGADLHEAVAHARLLHVYHVREQLDAAVVVERLGLELVGDRARLVPDVARVVTQPRDLDLEDHDLLGAASRAHHARPTSGRPRRKRACTPRR